MAPSRFNQVIKACSFWICRFFAFSKRCRSGLVGLSAPSGGERATLERREVDSGSLKLRECESVGCIVWELRWEAISSSTSGGIFNKKKTHILDDVHDDVQ